MTDGELFSSLALSGQGFTAGGTVRCEALEWAVRWHTGYPPRSTDRHDVTGLCERFGITVPEAFASS